jgi:hypothetical protein
VLEPPCSCYRPPNRAQEGEETCEQYLRAFLADHACEVCVEQKIAQCSEWHFHLCVKSPSVIKVHTLRLSRVVVLSCQCLSSSIAVAGTLPLLNDQLFFVSYFFAWQTPTHPSRSMEICSFSSATPSLDNSLGLSHSVLPSHTTPTVVTALLYCIVTSPLLSFTLLAIGFSRVVTTFHSWVLTQGWLKSRHFAKTWKKWPYIHLH